jgi:hypothetical protein
METSGNHALFSRKWTRRKRDQSDEEAGINPAPTDLIQGCMACHATMSPETRTVPCVISRLLQCRSHRRLCSYKTTETVYAHLPLRGGGDSGATESRAPVTELVAQVLSVGATGTKTGFWAAVRCSLRSFTTFFGAESSLDEESLLATSTAWQSRQPCSPSKVSLSPWTTDPVLTE